MPILQEKTATIILAAGVGKRMYSNTPKVLHRILGKPLIEFVLDLSREIESAQLIVVVNDEALTYQADFGADVTYAVQEKPLGSGDAARKGLQMANCELILILCGDVPLLRKQTINNLRMYHKQHQADLTILTCRMSDPFGYGRIIRGGGDTIEAIIEQTDATVEQQKITEINAGVYLGRRKALGDALELITSDNRQGEFYLTDAVLQIARAGRKVCGYMIEDQNEIIGVNTKTQLAQVRDYVKKEWYKQLMERGVYIEDPGTTSIDLSVDIGQNVRIRPHTMIEGKTVIPDGATVGPFVWLKDGKKLSEPVQ
jgi:bifunctional UDP-N-acetylglucosamine pyrophosphorylase/glucosamine-1-phosphate N-acetyltransferase